LLAANLVLFVAIHTLRDSRANNRHHMPNPQPGVAQPTQDRDTQATSNPLKMPFVISYGEGSRTPYKSSGGGQEQSPTLVNTPLLLQVI
jgi:hypothetical protein